MMTIRDKGALPEGDALATAVQDFTDGFLAASATAAEAAAADVLASDAAARRLPNSPTKRCEPSSASDRLAGAGAHPPRRRIRTVQSTKKITRAMELIAASRIVKAQARVQAAVPYANGITDVVRNLQTAGGGASHPMLVERENVRRVAHVVMTADRGLCAARTTRR